VTLLRAIELYLERTGTPPTRFGREAMGDPRIVQDLRRGRQLRATTAARLRTYLNQSGEAR
jgi:hypothetical protein